MLSPNQIEDIKTQAFLGKPSELLNIAKVYPLLISEIAEIGVTKYKIMLSTLLLTQQEVQNIIFEKVGKIEDFKDMKPLEYLLLSANQNDNFLLELKKAFFTFCQEEITLLPEYNAVVVGDPRDRRLITNENFGDFQDILRIQNLREVSANPPKDETPGERKMRLLREQVERVKRKQANKNNEDVSFSELLEIASVFGIDVSQCTIYSLQKLVMRHRLREKWNNDIQMICAGADSTKVNASYWGETIKT